MSIEKDRIKELSEMVAEAKNARNIALKKCLAFAVEHKLSFTWDKTYGSRHQTFIAEGHEDYEHYDDDGYYDHEDGGVWVHSSNC